MLGYNNLQNEGLDMIVLKEFIWKVDHYAYHVTDKKNLASIAMHGLLPKCGDRSKSIGDTRKAIYFFDCLESVYDWAEWLYEDKNIEDLALLRFNLKRRKWHIQNIHEGDFYLDNKVDKEAIELLYVYDENHVLVPLNMYLNRYNLEWKKITEDKKILNLK